MKLLLDTNIFIETLFDQERALEARALLAEQRHALFISLFSLHSIGVILFRRGRMTRWPAFLQDMILSGRVRVLTLLPAQLIRVAEVVQLYAQDFDDAYQYVTAEVHNLVLVSFDGGFDKTPRGRQTPQAINQLTAAQNLQDQQ